MPGTLAHAARFRGGRGREWREGSQHARGAACPAGRAQLLRQPGLSGGRAGRASRIPAATAGNGTTTAISRARRPRDGVHRSLRNTSIAGRGRWGSGGGAEGGTQVRVAAEVDLDLLEAAEPSRNRHSPVCPLPARARGGQAPPAGPRARVPAGRPSSPQVAASSSAPSVRNANAAPTRFADPGGQQVRRVLRDEEGAQVVLPAVAGQLVRSAGRRRRPGSARAPRRGTRPCGRAGQVKHASGAAAARPGAAPGSTAALRRCSLPGAGPRRG